MRLYIDSQNANYGQNDVVCVKFNALYDIAKNTFENANLLNYNLDVMAGCTEQKGFIDMGRELGKSRFKSLMAYKKAKKAELINRKQKLELQSQLLNSVDKLKILIVSHPYITNDN